MKIIIKNKEQELRVDKFLTDYLTKPRSQVQKLVKDGLVLVNEQPTKNNYKLTMNDEIIITQQEPEVIEIKPENIPLNIVYEDEYLLVVNKPSNMVVHPAVGNYSGTLVNALQYYSANLSDINGEFRPGIVHRIDKNTSGLLLIAKTNEVHNLLSTMIQNKDVKRKYKCLVHGKILEETALIKAPIGRNPNDRKKMAVVEKNSKEAQTQIKVVDANEEYSLLECSLLTGRTHQIRVHLKYINHPVVGDPQYGPKKTIDTIGQALHAYNLAFMHPITKQEINLFAPYPQEFVQTLTKVGLEDNDGI